MKAKLKREIASLNQPFGEFGIAYPPVPEPKPLTPRQQRKKERKQERKAEE